MEQGEYAIAVDVLTWIRWVGANVKERSRVTYLASSAKAEALIMGGATKGKLHRLPGWRTSDARELAESLEHRWA